jgi:hypothetical protein
LSQAGNYLLAVIQEIITRYSLSLVSQKWEFVLAHYRTGASLAGAIAIVVGKIHSDLYA